MQRDRFFSRLSTLIIHKLLHHARAKSLAIYQFYALVISLSRRMEIERFQVLGLSMRSINYNFLIKMMR